MVDEAYEQFVGIIVEGRGLSESTVKQLADGRIYTAKQALEHDLIDGICTKEEYFDRVQAEVGEDVLIYEREDSFSTFSSLFGEIQKMQPKSDAQVISELMEKDGIGGLMYYADIVQ